VLFILSWQTANSGGRQSHPAEETKAWRTNLIWSTGLVDYALRLTKPAESAQSASKINPPANRIVANKFIE
jgi:hypothetical protein